MKAPADRLEKSHIVLILLVSTASFFEGYDFIILNLVLPYLRDEFGLSVQEAGLAISAIALGTIAAFLVLRLGDYFGRRALLMWTVLGYTAATALTAASRTIYGFVALQFLARVFLVAEWGASTVIIAEELPASKRGIGISVVQAMAGVGAVAGSAIFPLVAQVSLGWRTMYLIGVLPLAVVFFIRRSLKETRRYVELRRLSPEKPRSVEVLGPDHRKNLVLVALLWFFMYFGYTPLQTFYTDYARNDAGLPPGQVGLIVAVAFVVGLSGYVVAGRLMDRWGRRPTSALFFSVGSLSTALAFNAPHNVWAMGLSLVVGIFFSTSYLPLVSTYTAELFPTRLRTSASAWANNVLGRVGMVLAPTSVGLLAAGFARPTGGAGGGPLSGVGPAVSILGLSPLVCALIVLVFLPETKGKELEEISA